MKVHVEDPLDVTDQIEVVCPGLVEPGTYFNCHVDIPRGSQLTASVTMADDVDTSQLTTTGNIQVPGRMINTIGLAAVWDVPFLLCLRSAAAGQES